MHAALKYPSRWVLLVVIALGTALYLYSQHLIGTHISTECGIWDALQMGTSRINQYLWTHPTAANTLMILYSSLGDLAVLTLFFFMIAKRSIRPVLPLFLFLLFRQTLQLITALPLPTHLIWHDPGFPSLFSNYYINNDFYFSAYVGINILMTLYLLEFRLKWLTILGFVIIFFEAFVDIVLRSHYTSDIYTSIITAVFAFLFTQKLSEKIDKRFQKKGAYCCWLIFLCAIALVVYHLVQIALSYRSMPLCKIVDQLHLFFLPVNHFIFIHKLLGNVLLALMNGILDSLTILIFVITLWKRDIRPFLILTIFFTLRQGLQMMVQLPLPEQTIWHYPGFPTLLQTYEISNDFYFSGHTGTSLLAALELSYFGKRWLTLFGFSLFVFEAIMVIVMQIHFTMDVFTAIMTVCCFERFSFQIAPSLNRLLAKLNSRMAG